MQFLTAVRAVCLGNFGDFLKNKFWMQFIQLRWNIVIINLSVTCHITFG